MPGGGPGSGWRLLGGPVGSGGREPLDGPGPMAGLAAPGPPAPPAPEPPDEPPDEPWPPDTEPW
jgi:hypothetical protein